jgi:hypothetical protein
VADDLYLNFKDAWIDRAIFGSSMAARLANARNAMRAQPDYSEQKYRAAVFAAEAEYHGLLGF